MFSLTRHDGPNYPRHEKGRRSRLDDVSFRSYYIILYDDFSTLFGNNLPRFFHCYQILFARNLRRLLKILKSTNFDFYSATRKFGPVSYNIVNYCNIIIWPVNGFILRPRYNNIIIIITVHCWQLLNRFVSESSRDVEFNINILEKSQLRQISYYIHDIIIAWSRAIYVMCY